MRINVNSQKMMESFLMEKPLDLNEAQLLELRKACDVVKNGIVSRTLLKNAGFRLVVFAFDEGQELTDHASTSHAFVQVLEGECLFKYGEEEACMTPGSLLHMPPNLNHSVQAKTPMKMLLMLMTPQTAPSRTRQVSTKA